jgi:hypothetical protein
MKISKENFQSAKQLAFHILYTMHTTDEVLVELELIAMYQLSHPLTPGSIVFK